MKRCTLIWLIIFIPLMVFSQEKRPNRTEFTKYPNDRQKKEEKIYQNNKLISWKQWYEDGKPKLVQTFKYGKKNGKFVEWYSNGNKKSFYKYSSDSIIDTARTWYESGIREYEYIYQDNILIATKKFDKLGNMTYVETYSEENTDRVEYVYFINKKVKEEKHLHNQSITKRIDYYPTGQIRVNELYNLGKINGPSEEYYENGIKKADKTYDNGALKKIVKYGEDGKIAEVVIFEDKTIKPAGTK